MRPSKIGLSCGGLERCGSIYDQPFVFVANTFEYKCQAIEACFLSPRVCDLMRQDPSMGSFDVEYNGTDGEKIFGILHSLLRGKTIELDAALSNGLSEISHRLGNAEILNLLIDGDSIELGNICSRLTLHSNIEDHVDREIEYAASHFYEIEESSLRTLPVCVLESVLSCESLRLKDEDSLLEFINTIDCDHRLLYRYLKAEYLSCKGIRLLVDDLNPESLDYAIWWSLCRRLLLEVCEMPSEFIHISEKRFSSHEVKPAGLEVRFDEGSPLNGIISFLTRKRGGNIDRKGIVHISSLHDGHNKCWQVADHGWSDHWNSKNERNSWISFDFKDRRVSLSHYTLKSHNGKLHFPRQWVIEGSDDSTSWTELDSRSTSDLVIRSKVMTYECSKASPHAFQYLRIRQTGPTSSNDHYLVLTNIEFFGLLVERQ
jgi:hypothetical protein